MRPGLKIISEYTPDIIKNHGSEDDTFAMLHHFNTIWGFLEKNLEQYTNLNLDLNNLCVHIYMLTETK